MNSGSFQEDGVLENRRDVGLYLENKPNTVWSWKGCCGFLRLCVIITVVVEDTQHETSQF
jgi:hypothetical protein